MTKRTKLTLPPLLFLALLTGLWSCGKFDLFEDKSKSAPEVEWVSINTINDITTVTGRVTFEGAEKVSICGFCYKSNETPDMTDNQILLDGTDGKFSASIPGLKKDSTYYFKAFVYNNYGYGITETKTHHISK